MSQLSESSGDDRLSTIRLQIHGRARDTSDLVETLAYELTEAVRSFEPGLLTYRWSRTADAGGWLIEEEYADEQAFAEHMQRMLASGHMRQLGKALEVERVLILSGDPSVVGPQLGGLPQVVYQLIESL